MVEEFRAEAQHNIPSQIDVIDVDLPRLELSESDLSQPRTEMEQHHAKEFFTPFDGVEGRVLMVKLKWIERKDAEKSVPLKAQKDRLRDRGEFERIGADTAEDATLMRCPLCPRAQDLASAAHLGKSVLTLAKPYVNLCFPVKEYRQHFVSNEHSKILEEARLRNDVKPLPELSSAGISEVLREVTSVDDAECTFTTLSVIDGYTAFFMICPVSYTHLTLPTSVTV